MSQYVLITVSNDDEMFPVKYRGFIDNKMKYQSTESYIGNSGVSITTYTEDECEDFYDALLELNNSGYTEVLSREVCYK